MSRASTARLRVARDLDEPPADRAELRSWLAEDESRRATMVDLLSPEEVAELLRVSTRTLANQRAARRGIRFVRLCGRPWYRRADVLEFIAANLIGTTAQPLR